jgi:hypothetical protein
MKLKKLAKETLGWKTVDPKKMENWKHKCELMGFDWDELVKMYDGNAKLAKDRIFNEERCKMLKEIV